MSRPTALWIAYLALAALLAVPLLLVEVPLASDTLNHLARIHVRAHIADDPDLARFFEIRNYLVPYMGLDWLMTPLARVMPTLVAGRVGIMLLLWGTVGAVVVLQRAFTGRIGFEPLLMGLVSYNALLAWGFLNYILGVIGALLGLAAWHMMRDRPRLLRLVVFTAVATAMYFVHLLALVLYGAMLGTYEVFGRPRAWRTPVRDWVLLAAQFLPAALLWKRLAMLPLGGAPVEAEWSFQLKILGIQSPFLFAGAMGGASVGLAVFIGCASLLIYLSFTGVLRWNRELAASAAGLMLMNLAVPTSMDGVLLGDMRLPAAAAYMFVAAVSVVPGTGKKLLPLGMLLAAAIMMQVGSAAVAMRACDGQYGELRAALQAIPRGAILVSAQEQNAPAPGVRCSDLRVYDHMAQLVTVERSGYSLGFFAPATAVNVRSGLPVLLEMLFTESFKSEYLRETGYLLWIHLGNHDRPLPPGLTLLRSGSFFDLFSTAGEPQR
ncbi:MAG TPA: hypothetical protein VGC15_16345 [Acetobacteraceae bacterium]